MTRKPVRSTVVSLPVVAMIAATTLCIGLAAGVLAQSPMQLVVYKNSVPTDARKWNGRLYIPVADVAKVMQWRLTVGQGKILLEPFPTAAAPAAVQKRTGNVGDELSTDKYKFRVNSITEMTRYERKYANGLSDATPIAAVGDEKLVVFDCVLTNEMPQMAEFCLSRDQWAENTMLIDTVAATVQPFAYDVAADEINPTGAKVLPGAQLHFALIFRVPTRWKSRAFNYSIVRYEERGQNHGTDVRVNLAP